MSRQTPYKTKQETWNSILQDKYYIPMNQRHYSWDEQNVLDYLNDLMNSFKQKKPLTVVKPGNQTRKFTHVYDTITVCFEAWKKNKCSHYSISNRKSYSIIDVAKMFKSKIIYLKSRPGERYASALTKISQNNKIIREYGKINLKDYVTSFIKSTKL